MPRPLSDPRDSVSPCLRGEDCPFCQPQEALWESEHYRVLADAFPRCAGHVLLVTRGHFASHMHAPEEWMGEFQSAQERVRRFLVETFGHAAFYENGGARQEVPHAHLHGLPYRPRVKEKWLEKERLVRISGWDDARRECEAAGHYFYLETGEERFLIRRYKWVLSRVRDQLLEQTEASLDPETGKMRRGGPEMIARTVQLWREWAARG